jgi:hypothetical protein
MQPVFSEPNQRPTEQLPALVTPGSPTVRPATSARSLGPVPADTGRGTPPVPSVLPAEPSTLPGSNPGVPALNLPQTLRQSPPVSARRRSMLLYVAIGVVAVLVVVGGATLRPRATRPPVAPVAVPAPVSPPVAAAPTPVAPVAPVEAPPAAAEEPSAPAAAPSAPEPSGARKQVAMGRLDVSTEPPMEIIIDGHTRGSSPQLLKLPVGTHKVLLKGIGQPVSKEQRVTLTAQGVQRLEWTPQKGSVEVRAVPPHIEMTVQVDGVEKGTTPLAPLQLWEGEHLISVRTAEGWSATRKVTVAPGEGVSVKAYNAVGLEVVKK